MANKNPDYNELADEVSKLIDKKKISTIEALEVVSKRRRLTPDQSKILEEKYMGEIAILIDYEP